jgi:hypothetical protein
METARAAVARRTGTPGGQPEASSPSAARSARRQPPQRPPRQPVAARQLLADAPAPREPTPVRPARAHQLPVFQAALPSSRGETYLRQRGGMLRCRRVTARCGCARARSMRWRCLPQGWQPGSHLRRPWLAVGLGTARARSGVGARRGHHGAAAVTSSLARPHCRGIASPCWRPWRMGTERCQRRMGGGSAGGQSRACSGPHGR